MRLLGLLLLLAVFAFIFAVYATAEPQLYAEVHSNGNSDEMLPPPKYGERRRAYSTAKATQATIADPQLIGDRRRSRISASENPARNANARMSRRYDAPERPASQQLVRQYKVPIVKKNFDDDGDHDDVDNEEEDRLPLAHKSRQPLHPQQQQQRHRSRYSNGQQQQEVIIRTDERGHQQQNQRLAQQQQSKDYIETSTTSQRNSNRSPTRRGNVKVTSSNANVTQKPRNAIRPITTTTTTTSTTTPRPQLPFGNFQFTNPFELITQNIWNFLNPSNNSNNNNRNNQFEQSQTATPAAHKKPPKKYTPPSPVSLSAAEKAQLKQKVQTKAPPSTTTTTTTTIKPHSTDGPFRIALPTFNFFQPPPTATDQTKEGKDKRYASVATLRERFTCPRESEVRFQLFPKICKTDADCSVWNREELCCEIFGAKSCVTGMPKPLEETSHMPILGLIPRKCPSRPLAELWWEVQECETDNDCWPRVCCPDGRRRYCRTSQPELETVPVPVRRSFNYLTEYLECTAPPPPIFDLHPKTCASTIECFPNVCCQEAGRRHCRPPKKSVLTLMANVFNVDFVKRLTQNIVIK